MSPYLSYIHLYSADSWSLYRPTVDRLLTDWRPTVDQLSTDCRPSIDRVSTDRYIARQSTDSRRLYPPTYQSRLPTINMIHLTTIIIFSVIAELNKEFPAIWLVERLLIYMGYWPSLFGQDGWILASFFFCEFMDLDYVSVHKHEKKNLANIQPSSPHTWSITHIYVQLDSCRL